MERRVWTAGEAVTAMCSDQPRHAGSFLPEVLRERSLVAWHGL